MVIVLPLVDGAMVSILNVDMGKLKILVENFCLLSGTPNLALSLFVVIPVEYFRTYLGTVLRA